MLEVIAPGILATIQDAGRPGFTHLGVPRSGACDPEALAIANVLLGNRPDAPGIEVTIGGLEVLALETCAVGIAGADLGAVVRAEADLGAVLRPAGRRLAPGSACLVPAGTRILFEGGTGGARAYLALAGGIDVPLVLDSASTYAPAGLGGIEGRALKSGDRIVPSARGDLAAVGRIWPLEGVAGDLPARLPVVRGPHAEWFTEDAFATLLAADWTVSPHSDRVGIRLVGPALPRSSAGELISCGMAWGAIQVPSDGAPIILCADHPTVGGYPVLAVVPSVGHPRLGQLCPGDAVRFEEVDVEQARRALRLRAEGFARAAAVLDQDAVRDRLDLEARD